MDVSRRSLVIALGASCLTGISVARAKTLGTRALAVGSEDTPVSGEAYADVALADDWLQKANMFGAAVGVFRLGRFPDRMYYLTGAIGWKPNLGQEAYEAVSVPAGFVTDFASIPRIFWSLLPTDGTYAYAAVIHDYLYWRQGRSREESDLILKFAMQDFHVSATTVNSIYTAVKLGGSRAWRSNRELRARGERRILREYPDDPTTPWSTWKQRSEVFADE
jgi:hypothetical protein